MKICLGWNGEKQGEKRFCFEFKKISLNKKKYVLEQALMGATGFIFTFL